MPPVPPLPVLVSTVDGVRRLTSTVEESRSLRQQRLQARFRARGGIFVQSEDNPLMAVLLARGINGESPGRTDEGNERGKGGNKYIRERGADNVHHSELQKTSEKASLGRKVSKNSDKEPRPCSPAAHSTQDDVANVAQPAPKYRNGVKNEPQPKATRRGRNHKGQDAQAGIKSKPQPTIETANDTMTGLKAGRTPAKKRALAIADDSQSEYLIRTVTVAKSIPPRSSTARVRRKAVVVEDSDSSEDEAEQRNSTVRKKGSGKGSRKTAQSDPDSDYDEAPKHKRSSSRSKPRSKSRAKPSSLRQEEAERDVEAPSQDSDAQKERDRQLDVLSTDLPRTRTRSARGRSKGTQEMVATSSKPPSSDRSHCKPTTRTGDGYDLGILPSRKAKKLSLIVEEDEEESGTEETVKIADITPRLKALAEKKRTQKRDLYVPLYADDDDDDDVGQQPSALTRTMASDAEKSKPARRANTAVLQEASAIAGSKTRVRKKKAVSCPPPHSLERPPSAADEPEEPAAVPSRRKNTKEAKSSLQSRTETQGDDQDAVVAKRKAKAERSQSAKALSTSKTRTAKRPRQPSDSDVEEADSPPPKRRRSVDISRRAGPKVRKDAGDVLEEHPADSGPVEIRLKDKNDDVAKGRAKGKAGRARSAKMPRTSSGDSKENNANMNTLKAEKKNPMTLKEKTKKDSAQLLVNRVPTALYLDYDSEPDPLDFLS